MRWVEAGGHLVVQYNRAGFNRVSPTTPAGSADAPSPFAPYPAAVTPRADQRRDGPRAAARAGSPAAQRTRTGSASATGRAGCRSARIQLLDARDPRYTELLASTDSFPYNPGEKRGLLVDATVGAGTWTYVGLVLFREVPAGVPGGWRLLANLVSRPRPAARGRAGT